MSYYWANCELPVEDPWVTHGLHTHGRSIGNPLANTKSQSLMDEPWSILGKPLVDPWARTSTSWDTYGRPWGIPWAPRGIPMGNLLSING